MDPNNYCLLTFLLLAHHSVLKKTTLIKRDPLVFALWSNTKKLNGTQCSSVYTAIRNKFQLIQGPPGN